MNKNVLIIDVNEIKSNSKIDINVDDKVLREIVITNQETKLNDILGDTLYNRIITSIYELKTASTPINDELVELMPYVKEYLKYQVISEFIVLNSFKLSNKGTTRLNDSNATAASTTDIEWYKNYYDNYTAAFKEKLIKYLKTTTLIEDYNTDNDYSYRGIFLDYDCESESNTTVVNNSTGSGYQGVRGFQGFKGEAGGAQGSQGVAGNGGQGFQGMAGFDGLDGLQGYQGVQGSNGNNGVQGSIGLQGSQGIQGVIGLQGVQGSQGNNGSNGSQGNQGNSGSNGVQGFQGNIGTSGSQGATGSSLTISIPDKRIPFGNPSGTLDSDGDLIYDGQKVNLSKDDGKIIVSAKSSSASAELDVNASLWGGAGLIINNDSGQTIIQADGAGLVYPRMSTFERDFQIPTKVGGQLIYNTDVPIPQYYDELNAVWVDIGGVAGYQGVQGAIGYQGLTGAIGYYADGTEDLPFNNNTGSGFNNLVRSLFVQSDGKVVVGGGFTAFNGNSRKYLVRLNPDGTDDTTFTTNLGSGFNNGIGSITVQSDGKIYIGGSFTSFNGNTRKYFTRLNSDGTDDTTFNTNLGSGFNFVSGGASFDDHIADLCTCVQSDGKIIVVGGFTAFNGNSRNYLIRLNSDGTEDTAFGINNLPYSRPYIKSSGSPIIQPDGKILVGGYRLNSDGTDDTTFNINLGSGFNGPVYDLKLQPDGKVVIVGGFNTINGVLVPFGITRLNSDGTIDTSFVTNIGSSISTASITSGYSICLQPDGKIIIGGSFTSFNGNTRNSFMRLNSDGTEDSNFYSILGASFVNIVYPYDAPIYTLSIANGRIYVGGSFTSFNGVSRYGIVRLYDFTTLVDSKGYQGYQGSSGGGTGSQGNQGFQGRQGFQGWQGNVGSNGSQGNQGFQGYQGFQGNQGYQGLTGGGLSTRALAYQALGSTIIAENVDGNLGIASNTLALVNQRAYFIGVYVENTSTISGIKWRQTTTGAYTASNANKVGLYSYNKNNGVITRVAVSDDTPGLWRAGTTVLGSQTFSSSYNALPGLYYSAFVWTSNGATTAPVLATLTGASLINVINDFTNSAKMNGFVSSLSDLPATYSMSGITTNNNEYWTGLF